VLGGDLVRDAAEANGGAVLGDEAADDQRLGDVLTVVLEEIAAVLGADVAVARVLDSAGLLVVRAMAGGSAVLEAELEGTHLDPDDVAAGELATVDALPASLRRLAVRSHARGVLLLPARLGAQTLGTVELMRMAGEFTARERTLARLAASQVALAVRAFGPAPRRAAVDAALELAGEALAATADEDRVPEQVARLAVESTGALAAFVWALADAGSGVTQLIASYGPLAEDGRDAAQAAAAAGAAGREPVAVEPDPTDLAPGGALVTAQLGRPPVGVLQLVFAAEALPAAPALAALGAFGARVAQALRSSARVRAQTAELERSRTLLAVVAEAIARLSLAHTLETAVERVAELLDADRVAVYLREPRGLVAAAERSLVGPHAVVAERLFELMQGPWRARSVVTIANARTDASLRRVSEAVAESGIEDVLALPLVVQEQVIGILAVYPPAGQTLTENESALLAALAGQLAVAVQNAQLHEQAKELGTELEQALAAERMAAQRLSALYEISRSFAQSLSLERTLDAVARTAVNLLGVDAAAIRLPDERGELLETQALHVADERLHEPLHAILSLPQPISAFPVQRVLRDGRAVVLDPRHADALGGAHQVLARFLEKGSTAVVVPIATPAEVLATLTLLSLDPGDPIGADRIDTALSLAGQAALAIDNARLYQQQKRFSDTMQRSLLPRAQPEVPGLELGHVYESSARVDVGGDVYDFMLLEDGRLAVVLGDVTGHGIDAAADMAMAKFVFRSLAREHPEPGDFLAHANEVVVGEIALGKFITLLYLTVDVERGEVACASGGHPPPRIVKPDGSVGSLEAGGLALGIESRQVYDEVRRSFEPGDAVVLYTDGVVEARLNGELYGQDRLDEVLARNHERPAREIALEVLADCRRFGGDLADDCAVVVLRRLAPDVHLAR
jgi:serine phosphatase RsbU (regulator of sigma subunit)